MVILADPNGGYTPKPDVRVIRDGDRAKGVFPIVRKNEQRFGGTTLAVKFKNGGTYHYSGVSAAQFEELKTAESVGSHLHKHFTGKHLGDKHPYVKLPNEH